MARVRASGSGPGSNVQRYWTREVLMLKGEGWSEAWEGGERKLGDTEI